MISLPSASAVRSAYEEMERRLGAKMGGAIVQPMAQAGVEAIVGLTVDPVFGPVVMVGLGGVMTDVLGDRAFAVPPLSPDEAEEMVSSLRAAPLLDGFRGTAPVDRKALVAVVEQVARIAEEVPELVELDLNPVIVTPDGALIVDCKARLAPRHLGPGPLFRAFRPRGLIVLGARQREAFRNQTVRRCVPVGSSLLAKVIRDAVDLSVSENRDANEASGGDDATTLEIGSVVTLRVEDLETLIARLSTLGYEAKGPVVRAGAIVPGALSSVDDLPKGVHDEQAPGEYRLLHGEDARLFDWAVGPNGWKAEFFPSHEDVWRAKVGDGNAQLVENRDGAGVPSPCWVLRLRPPPSRCSIGSSSRGRTETLDMASVVRTRSSRSSSARAPQRRAFATPWARDRTMETGFDLALTELDDEGGHRFLARVGSQRALDALEGVVPSVATEDDLSGGAPCSMTRVVGWFVTLTPRVLRGSSRGTWITRGGLTSQSDASRAATAARMSYLLLQRRARRDRS